MSTGISISSINRIKELAEEKKYREALDILDTQNLDKSINPQFLKISGEIFRENKRYYDSRRILLKAHQMAPQGTRILAELIQLYLELGYFSKAKKYYEQYLFYVTPDDTQKDYIEYMMKKATGTDVNDLAAILVPILERMPEDKWNFEAILLYHKMDRKDLALEEGRYILETFKESEYVFPTIDYIEDKLDVDYWFYVYPREEQPEDLILFEDLIELEEKILKDDHMRMYPPEARIVVEADDNDATDVTPVKEKFSKKRFRRSKKIEETQNSDSKIEELKKDVDSKDTGTDTKDVLPDDNLEKSVVHTEDIPESTQKEQTLPDNDIEYNHTESKEGIYINGELVNDIYVDEGIKQEREEALKSILAKKVDKDKIKESAKNIAKAMKEIDTSKAKQQIHSVAENVKGNVKKATDAFSDVVGVKQDTDVVQNNVKTLDEEEQDTILDGIIESVLEPPKQTIGEVVTNEELDALIPDSLEAMSEKEIADIEAKKEELNKLELEALEASLKREEERKAKKRTKTKKDLKPQEDNNLETEDITSVDMSDSGENDIFEDESEVEVNSEINENTEKVVVSEDDISSQDKVSDDISEFTNVTAEEKENSFSKDESNVFESQNSTYSSKYEELKNKFIQEKEEMKPLDSLGFISVVHSDVDDKMETQVPDAAGILKQMIDNKEFYSGEDSRKFESKDSYEEHGFEVENFDFETYRNQLNSTKEKETATAQENSDEEHSPVQEIYVKESVVEFENVVLEDLSTNRTDDIGSEEADVTEIIEVVANEPEEKPEEMVEEVAEEPKESDVTEITEVVANEPEEKPEETIEEVTEEPKESDVTEIIEVVANEPEEATIEDLEQEIAVTSMGLDEAEGIVVQKDVDQDQQFCEEYRVEEPIFFDKESSTYVEECSLQDRREKIRTDIVLTTRMQNTLLRLKESR